MKIMVLGATGMAGHVVAAYLRENNHAVDTLSATHVFDENTHILDVTDQKRFKDFLDKHQYDAVVNCIGLLVKQSDENKALAVYLNAYVPRFLEQHYKQTKTKVIHIGTDGVFSGKNPPYKEDSLCDGESFYGRSKALGDLANDKDVTFRTSIIGPSFLKDGTGLFHWFCQQKGEISGYTNIMWSGVTTVELAKAIVDALTQNLSGMYHLVTKDGISKFDLLHLCKETFNRQDLEVKPTEGAGINASLQNTRKDFDYQIPSYKAMLSEMKTWIEEHPELYRHYEA